MTETITLSHRFLDHLHRAYAEGEDFARACDIAKKRTICAFDTITGVIDEWPQLLVESYLNDVEKGIGGAETQIDWHATRHDGMTMLMAASYATQYALVEKLLSYGVPANRSALVDRQATSALIIALSRHNICSKEKKPEAKNIVRALLDAGEKPAAAHISGSSTRSPLNFVLDNEIAQWLLDAGANPEEADAEKPNTTALHTAVANLNKHQAELYMNAGVSLLKRDHTNHTALQNAKIAESDNREWRIDSMIPEKRREAEQQERQAGEIADLISDRQQQAEELFAAFLQHRDFSKLPAQALCCFSNIEKLDQVLQPAIWKGQETSALEAIARLPVWLQAKHAPEISTIYAHHLSATSDLWTSKIAAHAPNTNHIGGVAR